MSASASTSSITETNNNKSIAVPGNLTIQEIKNLTTKFRDGSCDHLKNIAVWVGCKPKFCSGMLGQTWHCDCDDHEIDTQCSALDINKIVNLAIKKINGPDQKVLS
jgi:hypothetical protein